MSSFSHFQISTILECQVGAINKTQVLTVAIATMSLGSKSRKMASCGYSSFLVTRDSELAISKVDFWFLCFEDTALEKTTKISQLLDLIDVEKIHFDDRDWWTFPLHTGSHLNGKTIHGYPNFHDPHANICRQFEREIR